MTGGLKSHQLDPAARWACSGAGQPTRIAYLTALIERKLADTHHLLSSEEVEIDSELEKSLEALGYLQ